jgi:hypothetical protein
MRVRGPNASELALAATLALLTLCAGCGATPTAPAAEKAASAPLDAGLPQEPTGSSAPRDAGAGTGEPASTEAITAECEPAVPREPVHEDHAEPTTRGRRADGVAEALVKEPPTDPLCTVDAESIGASPYLARLEEKVCTWMRPEERAGLARVDLSGTARAEARALADAAHDHMLRKLAPMSLARGRERDHRDFAFELKSAPPGKATAQGALYNACYGGPFFEACEQICDWNRPKTCRRCEDAWRKLKPLVIMCEPHSEENLVWFGTPEMGEGDVPASGANYFARVLDATVEAGVPRAAVARYATGLLKVLAAQARMAD